MNKTDITIIFSDLEGTILSEDAKDFSPEQFQMLISKINEFLSATATQLKFVIVSPIESKYMIPIIEKIQDEFHNFNMQHGTRYAVDLAACYRGRDDMVDLPNNILPILDANSGKRYVVNLFIKTLGERFNIKKTIYMGNGRNDIDSVEFLQQEYKDNAFTICP